MQIGPGYGLLHAIGAGPAPPVSPRATPPVVQPERADPGSTDRREPPAPKAALQSSENDGTGRQTDATGRPGARIDIQV